MSNKYNIIGLMSGTSLDGVDVVWVEFIFDSSISYHIKKAVTVPYDRCWQSKLRLAEQLNALDFMALHNEYGRYLGNIINRIFSDNEKKQIDFIASHGHTVFHQPEKNLTVQLGNGASICAQTKIGVINDFRVLDVALGGQGAPLVPIGDKLLFKNYDYCLNLGGFANISFTKNNKRWAFDICVANMALNDLANEMYLPYDKNGDLAATGTMCPTLFEKLNNLPFYDKKPPKSLGKEWYMQTFLPIIKSHNISVADKLRTVTEHIAYQIGKLLNKTNTKTLVTGGGAFNTFLTQRITYYSDSEIIIPDKNIVAFKEALIFAFLGALYMENKTNCLSSVTGAEIDNIGGCLWKITK